MSAGMNFVRRHPPLLPTQSSYPYSNQQQLNIARSEYSAPFPRNYLSFDYPPYTPFSILPSKQPPSYSSGYWYPSSATGSSHYVPTNTSSYFHHIATPLEHRAGRASIEAAATEAAQLSASAAARAASASAAATIPWSSIYYPKETLSSRSSAAVTTTTTAAAAATDIERTPLTSRRPSSRLRNKRASSLPPPQSREAHSNLAAANKEKELEEQAKQSNFLKKPISKEKREEMDLIIFNQIAEITPCLYLCAAAAVSREKVRKLQVTHIINCTLDVPNFKGENVECINIQVDDSSRAHLGIYFDRCADWIREACLKNGKVIVHCVAGVSRSASICIAYLMKYERMSLIQAYKFVKRKRSVIHPNIGFWQQLVDYEKRIFGRTTMKMVHANIGMVPEIYIEEEKELLRLQRYSRHR